MARAFCASTTGPRCAFARTSRELSSDHPARSTAAAPSPRGSSPARRHAVAVAVFNTSCRHIQRQASMTTCATKSTGESSTALAPDMKKTKVLFVCLGNICRSPTAEAVFKKVVDRSGVSDEFFIDSCGTGGGNENWYKLGTKDHWAYHEGKDADERMTAAAKKRDIHLTSKSRPLVPEDFQRFDKIIGMDFENSLEIKKAAQHWKDDLQKPIPEDYKDKIQLMCNYLTKAEWKELQEVPDPYFGGPEGFEKVLDLLEDACEGLLAHIESRKFATES